MCSNFGEQEAPYITVSERLTPAAGGGSLSVSQERPGADSPLDVKTQTTRYDGRERENKRPRREREKESS